MVAEKIWKVKSSKCGHCLDRSREVSLFLESLEILDRFPTDKSRNRKNKRNGTHLTFSKEFWGMARSKSRIFLISCDSESEASGKAVVNSLKLKRSTSRDVSSACQLNHLDDRNGFAGRLFCLSENS